MIESRRRRRELARIAENCLEFWAQFGELMAQFLGAQPGLARAGRVLAGGPAGGGEREWARQAFRGVAVPTWLAKVWSASGICKARARAPDGGNDYERGSLPSLAGSSNELRCRPANAAAAIRLGDSNGCIWLECLPQEELFLPQEGEECKGKARARSK